MNTNEILDEVERTGLNRRTIAECRLDEVERYLAAYDAACSLAIFVEHIVAGYPPRAVSPMVLAAKEKLRKLAALHGDFFTRFERVDEEWIGN